MKKLYLSCNKFTFEYYLDEGVYGKNRLYLGVLNPKGLIKILKKEINLKRKNTNFYVEKTFPKKIIKEISDFFENSKIEMKVVEDLKNI